MIRATYELEPAGAAAELARIESTGLPRGPARVRARVVSEANGRAVLDFPEANWGGDVTLLVSALLAGEWADSARLTRCRLVGLEWPDDLLPGPTFDAPARVLVGAIVKPSLGLSARRTAETAAAIGRGGADLVKDDELLGDPRWCPFEERVRRVVASIPDEVRYAPNVTGPPESLLARAERAVELGARALMLNVFAQGLGTLVALRRAELGVPLFAHRVGAALWTRQPKFGVAPAVVAGLTRLCGADYVQVGSFSGSVFDPPEEVREQVAACHRGPKRAVAVLGGGVGPDNAADQVRRSGAKSRVMVLLGSAAYGYPGGVEAAVRATVEAVR
ncbi:MAG TPA: RuBisCO large subunit C-terminal-like domain-containing protein [Gaiellaceae bacterium]